MSWRASALVSLPVLVACDGLLGIDPIDHGRATDAGNTHARGGRGGTANGGTNALPAGGTASGAAPQGGTAAGRDDAGNGGDGAGAGDGAGGRAGAGSGGQAGAGAESGTAALAAGAGAGGEGGIPEPPALVGADCELEDGEKACSDGNPYQILECTGGRWVHASSCLSHQFCRPPNAECVEYEFQHCYAEAFPRTSMCLDGMALHCGDDFSVYYIEECPYGCEAGVCLPGTGDDVVVHFREMDALEEWSMPLRVCFDAASVSPEMWGLVQDELETTFSRRSRVRFEFSEDCESGTGVEFALLDDCERQLANDVHWGRPSAQPERLEICRSYYDAGGERHESDEPLLRFLLRHQLGHVLSLLPEPMRSLETMMTRGFPRSKVEELRELPTDLYHLQNRYGAPFHGAFVTSSGRCLTWADGNAELRPCDDSARQRWLPIAGQIVEASAQTGGGAYLKAVEPDNEAGSDVVLTDFANRDLTASFELKNVQWRGLGVCVAADSTRTRLVTQKCGPYGEPDSSFRLDLWYDASPLSLTIARFQLSGSELCARVPEVGRSPVAEPGVVLELAPCRSFDAAPEGGEAFVLNAAGQIRFDRDSSNRRYVSPAYTTFMPYGQTLRLEAGSSGSGVWSFSGPIETVTSGGVRLALTTESPPRLEPVGDPPPARQIFDWYAFTLDGR